MSLPSLPVDVLECVFVHLDLKGICLAKAVCRQWREAGAREAVLVTASFSSGTLSRTQIKGLLGLREKEVRFLPCRPFVTRRGRTRWLFGPLAVSRGWHLVQEKRESRKTRHVSRQSAVA